MRGLIQIVSPTSGLRIEVIDLTAVADPERIVLVDAISTQEAQQSFDLTYDVPLTVKLLRLEENDSILTITAHQIVCDGLSVGILLQELSAAYNALLAGLPSPLSPLDFQYGDYVSWQHENQLSPGTREQLVYWKKQLTRTPQLQVLPDKTDSEILVEAGIVSLLLPRELTEKLRDLAKAENATFYVVTMAACITLLSRYTGESDIALRTPLAGRSRVEFEPIIGQFVNQVVIRSEVHSGTTVSGLLGQVRDIVWEALAHQDVAFEDVIQAIAAPHQNASDLFRINFVCQKEYGGKRPVPILPGRGLGDYDSFEVARSPVRSEPSSWWSVAIGWRLSLEFRTGLYTQKTAESLLLHFEEVLRFLAEGNNQKLTELLLSPTESLIKRTNEAELAAGDAMDTSEGDQSSQLLAMPGSLAQERFWTLSQLDPANPSFHVPVVMKIAGKLSHDLLASCFQLLVDRHESLRTTFSDRDGEFLQVIHPVYKVSLERAAIPGRNESERSLHLANAIQNEILKPFDLNVLPLFRIRLCRLSEEETRPDRYAPPTSSRMRRPHK